MQSKGKAEHKGKGYKGKTKKGKAGKPGAAEWMNGKDSQKGKGLDSSKGKGSGDARTTDETPVRNKSPTEAGWGILSILYMFKLMVFSDAYMESKNIPSRCHRKALARPTLAPPTARMVKGSSSLLFTPLVGY